MVTQSNEMFINHIIVWFCNNTDIENRWLTNLTIDFDSSPLYLSKNQILGNSHGCVICEATNKHHNIHA